MIEDCSNPSGRPFQQHRELKKGNGVAWCWMDKRALRKIREAFDRDNAISSALAVYLALCEIASNKESEVFQTTHSYIAQNSGVSIKTVQRRLKILEEIELIRVSTPNLRAPSNYTLLAVTSPSPNAKPMSPIVPSPANTGDVTDIRRNSEQINELAPKKQAVPAYKKF